MSTGEKIYNSGSKLFYRSPFPLPLSPTLPAGVYRASMVDLGDKVVPAFDLISSDNDSPIDCVAALRPIMEEVKTFLNAQARYAKFGFAHKRGYLLHGPPGCGKSSALRLLSDRFLEQTGGIVLRLDPGTSPKHWVDSLREHEGLRPVLAIVEDIDDNIRKFETSLLEYLDGATALNNFVFIATTNNLDAVPPRIKHRPSRIDRLVEIPFPDAEARTQYLARFPLTSEQQQQIGKATEGFSMAHLKEVVITHAVLEYPLKQAVSRVREALGLSESPQEKAANAPSASSGIFAIRPRADVCGELVELVAPSMQMPRDAELEDLDGAVVDE